MAYKVARLKRRISGSAAGKAYRGVKNVVGAVSGAVSSTYRGAKKAGAAFLGASKLVGSAVVGAGKGLFNFALKNAMKLVPQKGGGKGGAAQGSTSGAKNIKTPG